MTFALPAACAPFTCHLWVFTRAVLLSLGLGLSCADPSSISHESPSVQGSLDLHSCSLLRGYGIFQNL